MRPRLYFIFFYPLAFVCETVSHYVSMVVLELAVPTRQALNSQTSACLCLPSAGMTGVYASPCLAETTFFKVDKEIKLSLNLNELES